MRGLGGDWSLLEMEKLTLHLSGLNLISFGVYKEPFNSFISRWPEEILHNLKAKLRQLLVGNVGGHVRSERQTIYTTVL